MSDQKRTFEFVFNRESNQKFQEKFTVEVWLEGRDYEVTTEAYHPRYAYKITAHDRGWEYVDNDIRGGANEIPDVAAGAKSLFAFLLACQEGLPEDADGESENADLFPPHVREFAYDLLEEIVPAYAQLQKEIGE
ncbi:hypothetical protein CL65_gp055 [Mycobacterium phage Patience]|uniref:Uncharacterized protein n=1 Tax=Mycobacterium phage Patience TaxID=1074308 RepID=G1JWG5_9CAUD|nr:hypothetical protein CL65_gp055 [Mycobacterium phage Patience]AEL97963.1 hypothetical protein PATIENCE_54 [Mycobacterium phage Patience]UOW93379.1 hypothetical protein SEA_LABELLE_53 [Mycobacterium phage Labelle]